MKEESIESTNEFAFRKRRYTIPLFVAWVLFVISMFLPAFDDNPGWVCARHVLFWLGEISEIGDWEYHYYGAFNLSNLTMLLSPLFISYFPPATLKGRWVLGILSFCTLHVLSFSMVDNNADGIEYGYYIWVASFVVLTGEWLRQTFLHKLADS